jgi:hypothetical protein
MTDYSVLEKCGDNTALNLGPLTKTQGIVICYIVPAWRA